MTLFNWTQHFQTGWVLSLSRATWTISPDQYSPPLFTMRKITSIFSIFRMSSKFRAKWADQYFDRLSEIHKFIESNHAQVRIAMLDTGINASHPEMAERQSNGSIAHCKGFPDCLDPLQDPCGHGTHGASVLFRAAPNAVLLVAKVFDDNGKMPYTKDNIAITKVIRSMICWNSSFRPSAGLLKMAQTSFPFPGASLKMISLP